ncbi:2-succinyl-6-hydroxy-2,4-cyclohexadiene-1-carboxylate synthase [Shewanella sp. SR44-3]|uniref:2-succinyl-6-hydroxy-2, 4-cyclohexadiene-1-carboxylate synthase n=1 Tax=unclassified Shewanella TaxID=196818 RepID=UPI0015F9A601|nr:2-succinyl-6-hydroxy-2,4-cyclohexadiene-1-carboxylate synthase [Shewanella sp. SR44-3]MBB1268527.1 2-succinyl-6-hydroxy-2,4-cyclohexadiene-1-carboxylate synthase [Shewanella sp. SR44-3]
MTAIARFGSQRLPNLVLLHGFLGSKQDWQPFMPYLSQQFHCICIDLPGHGSGLITTKGQTLSRLVQAIISQIQVAIGQQSFHLLGYSLGGRLALLVADLLEKTAAQALLSLTLISCHPGLDTLKARNARRMHDNQWLSKLSSLKFAAFVELWYQQAVFSDLSPQIRAEMIAKRTAQASQGLSVGLNLMSLAEQPDCRQVPAHLSCPCHVFVGALDDKFTTLAKAWQQLVPINLQIFDNAGHTLHITEPLVFMDTLVHLLHRNNACASLQSR